MADIWPVNLRATFKDEVTELAQRRARLGLPSSYAATLYESVALARQADDDLLRAVAALARDKEGSTT